MIYKLILIFIFIVGDTFIIKEYYKTMKKNKELENKVNQLLSNIKD